MMVTFISSFVFAGVLSAYVFLGRGLTRVANAESLESRARLALYYFTQDVSSASTIIAQNPGSGVTGTQFTLNVPGLGAVVYATDWSLGADQGILTRQVGSNPALTLLTNVTSISFAFTDPTGNPVTVPTSAPSVPQIDIQQAYMTFTSTAGYAQSGAQSQFTVVSPGVTLKNKSFLKDPDDP
jgi:hypothetical protein